MATHKPFIKLFSRLAACKDNVVLAPQISYLSFLLIIPQSPMSSVFLFYGTKKAVGFSGSQLFHLFLLYLAVYMNNAKREAPATVMMPAATMAREDIAPSTAPISIALEVPMA